MSTGEELVKIMEEDGVPISDGERGKVISDLNKAIDEKRIKIIEKENRSVGFMTWIPKSKGILINYCFVYKAFRDKCTFLSLRNMFREMSEMTYWKSRRRERFCYVK